MLTRIVLHTAIDKYLLAKTSLTILIFSPALNDDVARVEAAHVVAQMATFPDLLAGPAFQSCPKFLIAALCNKRNLMGKWRKINFLTITTNAIAKIDCGEC
jgi:hypothetical protein